MKESFFRPVLTVPQMPAVCSGVISATGQPRPPLVQIPSWWNIHYLACCHLQWTSRMNVFSLFVYLISNDEGDGDSDDHDDHDDD